MANPRPNHSPHHTHAIKATSHWVAFRKALDDHATETAAERERQQRENADDTRYHRAADKAQ